MITIHDFKFGFEAEFISTNGDYITMVDRLIDHLSEVVHPLDMFDNPTWDEEYDEWYVCADSSLNETDTTDGVEIISPPVPALKFVENLKRVFQFIKKNGRTDETCGLHINISGPVIPSVAEILNHLDYQWADAFGRFDQPQIDVLLMESEDSKEPVINRHSSTHIEFKLVGGPDYEWYEVTIVSMLVEMFRAYLRAVNNTNLD